MSEELQPAPITPDIVLAKLDAGEYKPGGSVSYLQKDLLSLQVNDPSNGLFKGQGKVEWMEDLVKRREELQFSKNPPDSSFGAITHEIHYVIDATKSNIMASLLPKVDSLPEYIEWSGEALTLKARFQTNRLEYQKNPDSENKKHVVRSGSVLYDYLIEADKSSKEEKGVIWQQPK